MQEVYATLKCRTNTGIAWLYFFYKKCITSWKSTGSAGEIFLIAILQWLARDYFVIFPEFFFSAAFATALPKKSAYRYSWFCEKTPARRNNFFKFFHLNFIHSSNIENELLFKIERIVFVRNVATIYLRINWMIWFWILAPNLQMTSTYNNPFIVPIYHFIFFLISAIKVISAGRPCNS